MDSRKILAQILNISTREFGVLEARIHGGDEDTPETPVEKFQLKIIHLARRIAFLKREPTWFNILAGVVIDYNRLTDYYPEDVLGWFIKKCPNWQEILSADWGDIPQFLKLMKATPDDLYKSILEELKTSPTAR